MKYAVDRLAYTTHDVCERTGIPERTVRLLCKRRELQARKVGKRWIISHDALMHYLGCATNIPYHSEDSKQPVLALPSLTRR